MKRPGSIWVHVFTILATAAVLSAQTTVKICILGDSITESRTGYASYRYYLDQHLTTGGYAFDFVGHNYGVFGGSPLFPGFDQDHESYSGWRIEHIAFQLEEWAQETQPDIALIHLGTNDLIANQSVSSSIDELATLVDILRGVNPDITVLIAQIIPMYVPPAQPWRDVTALNAAIPAMVTGKDTVQSRVVTVDQNTGFSTSLLFDGLHPNDTGEQLMAQVWFDALVPFMTPAVIEFSNYGTSCQGTAPEPMHVEQIRGQAASLDHPYTVKVYHAPIGAALFGLLGTSDTSFGGGPLPIDLTLIGATGCSLLTGPEITFALSNQTGFASWTFLVPDDPLLVGAVIYEQAAALQVGLNPLGLTLSDAAKFTIVDKH
ncbi:MAG: hypothetical protein KDB80_15410 [Planctomycetes bacterium]|nr:hypothetical protein [Planctomycetota bacterium]